MATLRASYRTRNDHATALAVSGIEQATPARRKRAGTLPKVYALALLRLGELALLARHRGRVGRPFQPADAPDVALLAAHALAPLAGLKTRGRREPHPGLDVLSLADVLARHGLALDPDRLLRIVHHVERSRDQPRPFELTMQLAGLLVGLTREERTNLDIRTMDAVDEPTTARRERKREEKRAMDRERARLTRAAAGARPHAESERKRQPWKALGISESTWKRRKRSARRENDTNSSRSSYKDSPRRNGVTAPPLPSTGRESIRPADDRLKVRQAVGKAALGEVVRLFSPLWDEQGNPLPPPARGPEGGSPRPVPAVSREARP
jgi:hypothetical protein